MFCGVWKVKYKESVFFHQTFSFVEIPYIIEEEYVVYGLGLQWLKSKRVQHKNEYNTQCVKEHIQCVQNNA